MQAWVIEIFSLSQRSHAQRSVWLLWNYRDCLRFYSLYTLLHSVHIVTVYMYAINVDSVICPMPHTSSSGLCHTYMCMDDMWAHYNMFSPHSTICPIPHALFSGHSVLCPTQCTHLGFIFPGERVASYAMHTQCIYGHLPGIQAFICV